MIKNDLFNLDFQYCRTYLYAHLTGEDSFAASLDYWNVIADKVRELDCDKLLIHENLTGTVTENEMSDLVMDLKSSGLLDIRIAFYDENLDDTAINAFGQSLATGEGANIKIFHSLEEARHWIGQEG